MESDFYPCLQWQREGNGERDQTNQQMDGGWNGGEEPRSKGQRCPSYTQGKSMNVERDGWADDLIF